MNDLVHKFGYEYIVVGRWDPIYGTYALYTYTFYKLAVGLVCP